MYQTQPEAYGKVKWMATSIYFFIYFEPYEPMSVKKFENPQNKDHPNVCGQLFRGKVVYVLAPLIISHKAGKVYEVNGIS